MTPYTTCILIDEKIAEKVPDFTATKPDPSKVTVSIVQGDDYKVCLDAMDRLVLTATSTALTATNKPAIGRWTYQWYEVSDPDTPVALMTENNEVITGGTTNQLVIGNFTIDPVTGSRKFKIQATYTDLYEQEYVAESDVTTVSFDESLIIQTQPTQIDTRETTDVLTTSVVVAPTDPALPLDTTKVTYSWFINNVPIEGATDPDVDYEFSNWTTDTLGVKRLNDDAGTFNLTVHVGYTANGCAPLTISAPAILLGPGGIDGSTDSGAPPPPPPTYTTTIMRFGRNGPPSNGFECCYGQQNAPDGWGCPNGGCWRMVSATPFGQPNDDGEYQDYTTLWVKIS